MFISLKRAQQHEKNTRRSHCERLLFGFTISRCIQCQLERQLIPRWLPKCVRINLLDFRFLLLFCLFGRSFAIVLPRLHLVRDFWMRFLFVVVLWLWLLSAFDHSVFVAISISFLLFDFLQRFTPRYDRSSSFSSLFSFSIETVRLDSSLVGCRLCECYVTITKYQYFDFNCRCFGRHSRVCFTLSFSLFFALSRSLSLYYFYFLFVSVLFFFIFY